MVHIATGPRSQCGEQTGCRYTECTFRKVRQFRSESGRKRRFSPPVPQGDAIPLRSGLPGGARNPADRSMEPKTLFRKGMGHRSEHFVHPAAASNLALGAPHEANVVVASRLTDPLATAPNWPRASPSSSPPPPSSRRGHPALTPSVASVGSAGRLRRARHWRGIPSRSDRSLLSACREASSSGFTQLPRNLRDVGGVSLAPIVAFSPCDRDPRASDDSPDLLQWFRIRDRGPTPNAKELGANSHPEPRS